MSGADEGPVISTDVRLGLILYTPISKNMEAHIVFTLFVISFVLFFHRELEPLFWVKI